MNIHNKLKSLGFKKTQMYRPARTDDGRGTMVPDIQREISTYIKAKDGIPGRYERTIETIKHPKSNAFYKLIYGSSTIIWASVKGHALDMMWVEDTGPKKRFTNADINAMSVSRRKSYYDHMDGLEVIYNSNDRETVKVSGKDSIIGSLPTALRRDFLLSELFD